MDFILIFLLPKGIAALLVWCAVDRFMRAQRKGRLDPSSSFDVGAWGYNFVSLWVAGLLGVLVHALFWFCLGAFIGSVACEVIRDVIARWRVNQAFREVRRSTAQLGDIVKELCEVRLLYAIDAIDREAMQRIFEQCNVRITENCTRVVDLDIPGRLRDAGQPQFADKCAQKIAQMMEVPYDHH